ncbi:hypothetical protein M231_07214 [Tremella mesenterica]|uniref:Peroxin-3 n=1 Tax=Tremella mesenterica TaxID=5217 RepID=A0A4Q1BEI1_TREME|nr:hypothetical protein M231_07214 [Tremella mesenterica]
MPPNTVTRNPWQRRLRRFMFFVGVSSTVYLVGSYLIDRMRAARLRALKEKKERDLIKGHFTTLLSNISFTIYSLLPTLQPQLFDAYPVESTSQALQSLSQNGDLQTPSTSPADSMLLQHPPSSETGGTPSHPGDSWASEFQQREGQEPISPSISSIPTVSESHGPGETDDEMSSVLSQSISIPPTDMSMSSSSTSPSSDLSRSAQLNVSPPRLNVPAPASEGRSKKELWRDLKIQSITRAISTVYLLPLIYILTTSQLSILARRRYLTEVKSKLPSIDEESSTPSEDPLATPTPRNEDKTSVKSQQGWISYLASNTGVTTVLTSRPVMSVASSLPVVGQWFAFSNRTESVFDVNAEEARLQAEAEAGEAERVFLTYSWWLLHEGWKSLASRVEKAVTDVMGGVGLKRQLTVEEWESLLNEIRASVETDTSDLSSALYSFEQHILPPTPLPETSSSCPLPSQPTSPLLLSLLKETKQHIASPDGRYLLDKGATMMMRKLVDELRQECYDENGEFTGSRLAECLLVFNAWSKNVWEGIPDKGVEALLAVKEYEGFAALIFGDWADNM